MGILVHHSELDKKRWDDLVDKTPHATIFSRSFYWDATADDWYVYLDENFRYGIPIGCTKKIGVLSVYPPFFHRYAEIIGDFSLVDQNHFWRTMQQKFPKGVFQLKQDILPVPSTTYCHQVLKPSSFRPKEQAKRMLKKANKKNFVVRETTHVDQVIQFIITTLSKRMALYDSKSVKGLVRLVKAASEVQNIHLFELYEAEVLKGAIIGLNDGKTMLYLKGACVDDTTQHGGMYLLMKSLIEKAEALQLNFDFGGSRVEGVRFFNSRFQGEDEFYYAYSWDNSPIWFKVLSCIKKGVIKHKR